MDNSHSITKLLDQKHDEDFIISTVKVNSLEEYKSLFVTGISDEQMAVFAENTPVGSSESDGRSDANVRQEIIKHVYGNTDLKSQDARMFLDALFPVDVQVMTGKDVVISTDRVIGPSSSPFVIKADTLTFDGGSLTVITTALTIYAETLFITQKTGSKKSYHIGIFGQTGDAGIPGTNGRGYDYPAQPGAASSPLSPGICGNAGSGGAGDNGNTGTTGGNGLNGKLGIANFPATIHFKNLDPNIQQIILSTKSGEGGLGGIGGKGGDGQTGGTGGAGCYSGCEGTDGGGGGNGGDGGLGGNGGDGADGADGNPIAVTLPESGRGVLKVVTNSAAAGAGGLKGNGGEGGYHGPGGAAGKYKSAGPGGSAGGYGSDGKAGLDGKREGAPGTVTPHFLP